VGIAAALGGVPLVERIFQHSSLIGSSFDSFGNYFTVLLGKDPRGDNRKSEESRGSKGETHSVG
jgi:hypothetical protein